MGIVVSVIAAASAAAAQSDTPERRPDTSDVLFFAAEAPLWLRLEFAGGDRGVATVRTRYAKLLLQSVDQDGDDLADADEAPRLPATVRADGAGERLADRWSVFDTSPQDGRLSAEEYLAAIDAQLGPRLIARRKPPLLAQSVQLLPRLDQDHDQRVSREEIQQATHTLRQFDFDDDGTFSPAELQPFPQLMVDAAMAAVSGGDEQPFHVIDASTNRAPVIERLIATYGDRGGIPRERSGLSEFAFAEADRDESGRLDAVELAPLIDQPRPIAEIRVDLFAGRVTLERPQRSTRNVEVLPAEGERRLALRLGAETVEFSAHDNRYEASDQINLLRIRFLQGDADKNGYLGSDEFASLAGLDASFDAVDGDHDGQIFIEELDRYIRLDSYLAQCALEIEVEAVEKPLFRILDTNLDRRLTAREFAAGQEHLHEYDQDQDGILDARELDLLRRFRVRFGFVVPPAVRPDRSSLMAATRRMPVTNRMTQTGPQWFQSMDRNQDGDVTWREFLGPREAFERLDVDGSGWIDEAEAAARAQ